MEEHLEQLAGFALMFLSMYCNSQCWVLENFRSQEDVKELEDWRQLMEQRVMEAYNGVLHQNPGC